MVGVAIVVAIGKGAFGKLSTTTTAIVKLPNHVRYYTIHFVYVRGLTVTIGENG